MILFRTDVVKGAIAHRFGSQAAFARAFPMQKSDVNAIINNRRAGFTAISLNRWCQLLGLQPGDFLIYVPVEGEGEDPIITP